MSTYLFGQYKEIGTGPALYGSLLQKLYLFEI